MNDIVTMLQDREDPATGLRPVDLQQPAILWTDASRLAIGVALEIGGSIVEDAAWLRKVSDSAHIKMSRASVSSKFPPSTNDCHPG